MSDDVMGEIERMLVFATCPQGEGCHAGCGASRALARIAREQYQRAEAWFDTSQRDRQRAEKVEAENARLREALRDYIDHEDSRHDDCELCDRVKAALRGAQEKADGE